MFTNQGKFREKPNRRKEMYLEENIVRSFLFSRRNMRSALCWHIKSKTPFFISAVNDVAFVDLTLVNESYIYRSTQHILINIISADFHQIV